VILTSESYLHNVVFEVDPAGSFLYCFNKCFLTKNQHFAFLLKFPNSYYLWLYSVKTKQKNPTVFECTIRFKDIFQKKIAKNRIFNVKVMGMAS